MDQQGIIAPTQEKKFNKELYDHGFFQWHHQHVHESYIKAMEWYINQYNPGSCIDIGCGIGSFFLPFISRNNSNIVGLDVAGEAAKPFAGAASDYIYEFDCTEPISNKITNTKYDCVISFETAEHIEPSGTDQFVKNLVEVACSTILFSAAPEGQDGTGHINCRPKSYWIGKFAEHGFSPNEDHRRFIADAWKNLGVPEYVLNNLIVFKKLIPSYSQNNEQQTVLDYFNGRTGCLLDVGANDGITLSNSYGMIQSGWKAVLLEPSKAAFEKLKQLHESELGKRVWLGNFGIADGATGEKTFYESGSYENKGSDIALLSSANPEEIKRWNGKVDFTTTTAMFLNFPDFIHSMHNIVKKFEFISIDAEGYDYDILKQINLSEIGCECLCIEHNSKTGVADMFKQYCGNYGLVKQLLFNNENIILAK